MFDFIRNLVLHGGGRGAGSYGINERKGGVKFTGPHHFQRILKILLGFSRKAHDNIGCDGHIWYSAPYPVHQINDLLLGITAVHGL